MKATMNPTVHKRFLDYRDKHEYFGRQIPLLKADEFVTADAEQRTLEALGDARDDEEEERFAALSKLLLRD